MGSPQERTRGLTEKCVEVSIGNGAIIIPFDFGRQPVSSDAMQARLDGYAIAGAKVEHPDWTEYSLSDAEILEEVSVGGDHPLDKAPFYSLGLVLSEEGFGKYEGPFESLGDPFLRDVFRAITDPLVEEPYYNPAQIARRALFRPDVKYPDNKERYWDAGELVSHLTITLAERGRIFNTRWDEHAAKTDAHYRWPADLAEMLGIAYLLGERKIEEDDIKNLVQERMRENLESVTHVARLSGDDQAQIAAKANELAETEVLVLNP